MKPTIFVSCGQVTPEEIALGKNLVRLINQDGRYHPYFAEDQSSLEGVTNNILGRLETAAAFVAVIHPRGEVQVPDTSKVSGFRSITRASVWIEQEIAILAMLSQIQKKTVNIQLYSKRGVTREGLRSYVMTNPYEFGDESEVLEHFAGVLAGWVLAPPLRGVALRPVILRQPHGLNAEMSILRVAFHNAGDEQATDARVRMTIPMKFIRHGHINYEKSRNSHLEMEIDRSSFEDQKLFDSLYANDTTRFVQELYYYVDASYVASEADVFEVEIRSGNAPVFVGRVTIAELQETVANEKYMMLPAVGGVSSLVPFSGA
jgi:hypothetical protein